MNYGIIKKLSERLFFTPRDVALTSGIRYSSAKVLCSRYTKKGIFVRLKKDLYMVEQNLKNLTTENLFTIANFLQVPSYISFMTALSYYGISTQIQRNFIESASIKRTKRTIIKGINYNFYKINRKYYFDFIKSNNYFIATKEKAFVDSVYLYTLGKYRLDFSSIDFKKLDKVKLKKTIKPFPERTKLFIRKICLI